ncbi:MAG TPA: tetratricopeptide repeat protein, partial [Bacteroidia bacterium]|nr:tetratricopeptide repeat protein [Bacteroidia bacterium]
MKRLAIFLLPIFLFYFSSRLSAQQAKMDSIYQLYLYANVDTTKVNYLTELSAAYEEVSKVKGLAYSREALELASRIKFNKGICIANRQIGEYYYSQLNYSEAIKHFLKAIEAGEDAKMYGSVSRIYNLVGIIYSNQEKEELSLKYFLKVAEVAEKMNDKQRVAVAYNNIGIAYKGMGRYNDAKAYYLKALKEFEATDFKRGIASVSSNLGIISHILKDDEAALKYYETSISKFREMKDTASESGIWTNVGELYNDKGEYRKALAYYEKGLKYAGGFNNNGFRQDAYDGLSKVYANLKNYEMAYYYKNKHIALRDSVKDEEGMREVAEMEKRMNNEKQEKEIELLKQKEEIQSLKVKSQSEKLKKSNIIIFSVAGVLIVMIAMSFFIYKAYKQIKKTNFELAEKKKEIQDSINYAKKIQESMLPEVSILANHFPKGGFGFYQPKDVVSGDFYWFSELNGAVYFAAADCTGHGVPGAFMSMIGIDKLNSFMDKKVEHLPQILSLLNISIKRSLKQKKDSSSSKDGMDIALCSLNTKTKVLNYAGANRPLWILRNNEIMEYKPTKASIAGYVEDYQEYIGHKIQLQDDDMIYLFS